jgi:hypothetical protein
VPAFDVVMVTEAVAVPIQKVTLLWQADLGPGIKGFILITCKLSTQPVFGTVLTGWAGLGKFLRIYGKVEHQVLYLVQDTVRLYQVPCSSGK